MLQYLKQPTPIRTLLRFVQSRHQPHTTLASSGALCQMMSLEPGEMIRRSGMTPACQLIPDFRVNLRSRPFLSFIHSCCDQQICPILIRRCHLRCIPIQYNNHMNSHSISLPLRIFQHIHKLSHKTMNIPLNPRSETLLDGLALVVWVVQPVIMDMFLKYLSMHRSLTPIIGKTCF